MPKAKQKIALGARNALTLEDRLASRKGAISLTYGNTRKNKMPKEKDEPVITPLVIIERWIYVAEKNRMGDFTAIFWTIRDVFEGVLRVSDSRIQKCIDFVEKECRPGDDKETLVSALREKLQKEYSL